MTMRYNRRRMGGRLYRGQGGIRWRRKEYNGPWLITNTSATNNWAGVAIRPSTAQGADTTGSLIRRLQVDVAAGVLNSDPNESKGTGFYELNVGLIRSSLYDTLKQGTSSNIPWGSEITGIVRKRVYLAPAVGGSVHLWMPKGFNISNRDLSSDPTGTASPAILVVMRVLSMQSVGSNDQGTGAITASWLERTYSEN